MMKRRKRRLEKIVLMTPLFSVSAISGLAYVFREYRLPASLPLYVGDHSYDNKAMREGVGSHHGRWGWGFF